MLKLNRYDISFIGLLLFHFIVLVSTIQNYSISSNEANIFYNHNVDILTLISHFCVALFGQNDYSLRIPLILFYIGSSILLYLLTDDYFKTQRDRLINVAIFMILPGVNSAAILLNESIIVIFCTLLFLYLYKLKGKINYFLLIIYLFIDNSFAILFLALFFYALNEKNNKLVVISLLLFGISMGMYGFEVGGIPKGYFLDTLTIYATIFSPFLFIYFFYSIYRVGTKFKKDLFWYISTTALGLSLLFSLRQKIAIEDFAPFVVIALPIMTKLFSHSLNVRLREFRGTHYLLLKVAITTLLISFLLLILNKYFYLIMENPQKHFARKHHIAKELSLKLKELNINYVKVSGRNMNKRLKFYGIIIGNQYILTKIKVKNPYKVIKLKFYDTTISKYYVIKKKLTVTKLNKTK